MKTDERQVIEQLFVNLEQIATQNASRDHQVEAYINQRVANIPGATYYMAQVIMAQQ